MSHVMCHASGFVILTFFFFFLDKMVELVGGGSVINRGLPRLVFRNISLNLCTMQQTAGPVKRVQLQLSASNPQPTTQRQEARDEINPPGT